MINADALRRRDAVRPCRRVVAIISVLWHLDAGVHQHPPEGQRLLSTPRPFAAHGGVLRGAEEPCQGHTGNFAFYKVVFYSFFITITSTALILVCTSMAAWYIISRVGSLVSKIVYYLCVFSMVVPFQMVMSHPLAGRRTRCT